MRGLNVCVLGPAALILTAVVIALTPLVGNAAEPSATMPAAGDESCQVADAEITWGVTELLRSDISSTVACGERAVSDGASKLAPPAASLAVAAAPAL